MNITFHDGATASGNGATASMRHAAAVVLQVQGLTASTVAFQGSVDGSNWVSLQARNAATGQVVTQTDSDGVFIVPAVAGYLRCPITSYGGGDTIDVLGYTAAITPGAPAIGGEGHLGEVGGNSVVADLTLSLDTSAYADGDVLAATQPLADAMRVSGGTAVLHSLQVIDIDAQGQALDVVLLASNVSIGSENSPVALADGDADQVLGIVSVASADYVDTGGQKIASLSNLGLVLQAPSGARDLYVAAISRGTGTYTASGIVLRFGLLRD